MATFRSFTAISQQYHTSMICLGLSCFCEAGSVTAAVEGLAECFVADCVASSSACIYRLLVCVPNGVVLGVPIRVEV